jgi:hypothetical protein
VQTVLNLFCNSWSGSPLSLFFLFLVAELLRAIVAKATGLPENHSHSSWGLKSGDCPAIFPASSPIAYRQDLSQLLLLVAAIPITCSNSHTLCLPTKHTNLLSPLSLLWNPTLRLVGSPTPIFQCLAPPPPPLRPPSTVEIMTQFFVFGCMSWCAVP